MLLTSDSSLQPQYQFLIVAYFSCLTTFILALAYKYIIALIMFCSCSFNPLPHYPSLFHTLRVPHLSSFPLTPSVPRMGQNGQSYFCVSVGFGVTVGVIWTWETTDCSTWLLPVLCSDRLPKSLSAQRCYVWHSSPLSWPPLSSLLLPSFALSFPLLSFSSTYFSPSFISHVIKKIFRI